MATRSRYFQFYLSTAIAAMLAASVIIYLNTKPRYELIRQPMWSSASVSISEAMDINSRIPNWGLLRIRRYGWPYLVWERRNWVEAHDWKWIDRTVGNEVFFSDWVEDCGKMNLVPDLLVGVSIVLSSGVAFQLLIRALEKIRNK